MSKSLAEQLVDKVFVLQEGKAIKVTESHVELQRNRRKRAATQEARMYQQAGVKPRNAG